MTIVTSLHMETTKLNRSSLISNLKKMLIMEYSKLIIHILEFPSHRNLSYFEIDSQFG